MPNEKRIISKSKLDAIARAIREKTGSNSTYTPDQMVAAIGAIETQGDYQEKTFTENGTYTPDAGYDAFSQVTVNVQSTGSNPLQDMLDRSSNTDGSYLFSPASSGLFSQLTYEILITLDFSNKHYTNAKSMFNRCSSLTTVPQLDFSSVTGASGMFSNCSSLVTIPQLNFSSVTNARDMFSNCSSLVTIPQLDFNSVTDASFMFAGCKNLTTLDFSNIKTIGSSFALNASSLSTLIIRNTTTLATLANTNAFSNTPIASGTGYIYVPDDRVDSYKQATNWSTYASQIKGLNELPQGE